MPALPITTDCYTNRLAVLQSLLQQILADRNAPECSSELVDCFENEARHLQASIWAMHAEVEQD